MGYRADIARRPMAALFDLRGDAAAVAACLHAAGLTAPAVANSSQSSGDSTVFWIGPKRWLLRTALAREGELVHAFHGLVADRAANATLVSDAWIGFALSGPEARDVLAQGCPLDLSPRHFALGAATMTELFGSPALIHAEASADGFAIYVEASHADFIESWLARARGD
ncbi:MAG: hypothetical protein FJX52_10755 [Alphaproteobacteria bacterium]|nr:hypothetical protein [Alphaproteobacteria bacterium]